MSKFLEKYHIPKFLYSDQDQNYLMYTAYIDHYAVISGNHSIHTTYVSMQLQISKLLDDGRGRPIRPTESIKNERYATILQNMLLYTYIYICWKWVYQKTNDAYIIKECSLQVVASEKRNASWSHLPCFCHP